MKKRDIITAIVIFLTLTLGVLLGRYVAFKVTQPSIHKTQQK